MLSYASKSSSRLLNQKVLILVLMEYALLPRYIDGEFCLFMGVLILVLMEYALLLPGPRDS